MAAIFVVGVFLVSITVTLLLTAVAEYNDAYQLGREARKAGVPREHSLYPFNPRLHMQWQRGYDDESRSNHV